MENQEKLKTAYIEHLLENGSRPSSIFSFTKKLEMKEVEFYEYYNSFELLESNIWKDFITETINKISNDETYSGYTVREKLLAFYYTLIETLKQQRSYTMMCWKEIDMKRMKTPTFLTEFKTAYKEYMQDLIQEGKESGEVEPRRYLDNRYADFFWVQIALVMDFWVKDASKGFEKTDAFIEKSVNTSFDLIGASALDSVLDLAKFVYQNR